MSGGIECVNNEAEGQSDQGDGRPADWSERFNGPREFHEQNLRRELVQSHEWHLRAIEQIRTQERMLMELRELLRECDRLAACMVDAGDGLAVRPDRLASYKAAVLGIVAISRQCKLFRTMPEVESLDARYELPAGDGAFHVER